MKYDLSYWSNVCYDVARKKGFWDGKRNMGEMLMLIVTEISEAMEGYRKGNEGNFNEEIADAFIRLFDLCGGLNINIENEIIKKLKYNRTRPYKHGKNC